MHFTFPRSAGGSGESAWIRQHRGFVPINLPQFQGPHLAQLKQNVLLVVRGLNLQSICDRQSPDPAQPPSELQEARAFHHRELLQRGSQPRPRIRETQLRRI